MSQGGVERVVAAEEALSRTHIDLQRVQNQVLALEAQDRSLSPPLFVSLSTPLPPLFPLTLSRARSLSQPQPLTLTSTLVQT